MSKIEKVGDENGKFEMALVEAFPTKGRQALQTIAQELRRHTRIIQRIGLEQCNRPERPYDKWEQRNADAEAAIVKLCQELGDCTPIFDGDPRGYMVKLKLPTGRYNNLGGEGWGVPY